MLRPWTRVPVTLAAALVALAVVAPPAHAKVLPVGTVAVITRRPTVGQPVIIELRFANTFDIGDYAWENDEVFVIPAERANVAGWPLDAQVVGQSVPLRRFAPGAYRGSVVIANAGDYVVLDRSAVTARTMPDNAPRPTAGPVRIHVGDPAAVSSKIGDRPTRGRLWLLPLVALVALSAIIVIWARRRRRRVSPSARDAQQANETDDERDPVRAT